VAASAKTAAAQITRIEPASVFEARGEIHAMHVAPAIEQYIMALVDATRHPANYDKALAKFKLDPQTDAAGKPVLGPDHQLSTATTTNVAGETVAAIDFNTDQSAAKTSADTDVARLSTTLADAKSAAAAAPGDATLKAAQAKAQSGVCPSRPSISAAMREYFRPLSGRPFSRRIFEVSR